MTAGFSHEFASPLNALRLRLEREGRVNSSLNIQEALQAAAACEEVLRQMNQAQLDAREQVAQEFFLDALVRDVVKAWEEEHPGLRCETEIASGLRVELPMLNLAQALMNFLDNAWEASPATAPMVRTRREGRELAVEVRDRGEGFSADVLARFGEPFVTTKKEGTGLGLYSAQLFAQSLGGRVLIENEAGGAKVQMRLPWTHVKEGRHA